MVFCMEKYPTGSIPDIADDLSCESIGYHRFSLPISEADIELHYLDDYGSVSPKPGYEIIFIGIERLPRVTNLLNVAIKFMYLPSSDGAALSTPYFTVLPIIAL